MVSNESGALHLPMSMLFVVIFGAATALVVMMHEWRLQAELQLRLDQCVGQKAAMLRDRQRQIEAGNQRIRVLRIALIPASIRPEIRKTLEAALKIQVLLQDALLKSWKVTQIAWIAHRGCGGNDIPFPLPSLAWVRDLPDALGPRPLRWPESTPKELSIRLHHSPRHSAARVFFSTEEENSNEWVTAWGTKRTDLP